MNTILVTGARGTVGSYVVALAEASGYRVVASDLSSRGVRVPARGEVRPADLRDPHSVAALVKGCDVVIHTAAQLDPSATAAELSVVNTEAVGRLYEAAAEAGAERFVHMNVATLYDSESGDGPLDEDTPLAPRGPYAMSKHGAEVYLRGRTEGGPAWTILRAAPIYGRRGRHFAGTLLAIGPLVRLGSPVLPRPAGGPLGTMVHAEDVARALLFVIDKEDAFGRVLNVADGDVMPLGERIGVTFDAYGLKNIATGTVPEVLFEGIARLMRRRTVSKGLDFAAFAGWRTVVLRHGLKPALRPRFDEEVLELLHRPLVVDDSAIRALGFTPRHQNFDQGWREVLRWYQAERWVPRYY